MHHYPRVHFSFHPLGFVLSPPLSLLHFRSMSNTTVSKSNRYLDAFLMEAELHIDPTWAMAQLGQYLQELDLLAAGAPYADLGISQRRHAELPMLLNSDGKLLDSNSYKFHIAEYTPPNSYVRMRLEGVMRSTSGASTYGITKMVDNLQVAAENPNIIGVLIEGNTGGGESTAGAMLHGAIASFPKAVVVYAHRLASAGIMGTLAADEIIASTEMASIGSIGTFLSVDKKFAQWYSENYEDIYASGSTNKNEEFRAMLKGDYGPISRLVDKTNDFFTKEVKQYRQLNGDATKVEDTLSGRTFFAREAKSRGLIDGIGSFQYALSRLDANVKRRKKMMK